jgi:gliding motility-associated-like protein
MRNIFTVFVATLFCGLAIAQPDYQNINFNSGQQGMFDPSYDPTPYSPAEYFAIPPSGPIEWNEGITIGDTWSTGGIDLGPFGSFPGFSFGASFFIGTRGKVGLEFAIEDFTDGKLEVNYPVRIKTTNPNDGTFNAGSDINLGTSYTVRNGHSISTQYPDSGVVRADMFFELNAGIRAEVALGPATFEYQVLGFDIDNSYNLFYINQIRSYYYGAGSPIPPYAAGYPNGLPDIALRPCTNFEDLLGTCVPLTQVFDDDMPVEVSEGALSGEFTLPFVPVENYALIGGKDLRASGDSTYITLKLDVFNVAGAMVSKGCGTSSGAPNPYCVAAEKVLQNMQNDFSIDIPGLSSDVELSYNIMNADMVVELSNNQQFDFTPTVYGRFKFPTPVEFKVFDAALNQTQSGASNIIDYTVGDSVRIEFPCFYEEMQIERSYSIDGKIRSNTYDVLAFKVLMGGMGAKVNIPGFSIIPSYDWSICIPWGYPCGSAFWPSWCSGETCTDFSTPSVDFPNISFGTCDIYSQFTSEGPNFGQYNASDCSMNLVNETLGSIDMSWHDQTWSLEGFDPIYPADTLKIRARQFLATATSSQVDCFGGNTGNISVTIQNGNAPFTVLWSNGTNQNVPGNTFISPNFAAGNYIATITDSKGCQAIAGATILEPIAALGVESTIVADNCNNAIGNGSITINTVGGRPAYNHSWTGPSGYTSNSESITNLQPGTYTLNILDATSCPFTDQFIVNQPAVLKDSLSIVTNVDCNSNATGTVDVMIIGGNSPYTYAWEHIPTATVVSTDPDLTSALAANYTLNVSDVNGCTFTENHTITEPTALVLSRTSTNVSCFDGQDGAIDVTISGGTPFAGNPYTFSWFNGNSQLIPDVTEDLSGILAGNYLVEITDSNGCEIEIGTEIFQPDAVTLTNSIFTNIDCKNNNSGSIDITTTGGTGALSFDWSNDGTGDFDDLEDASNLLAGDYDLVIRDANLCLFPFDFTLTEPENELSATSIIEEVKCFGDATGSIDVTTVGGTSPYAFSWTNSTSTEEDLEDVIAGTYDVTVTDDNNCLFTLSNFVAEPAAPLALSETHVDVLCYDEATGSINLTITGGTPGINGYAIEWYNGSQVTLADNGLVVDDLKGDTYSVIVTDGNGCIENLSVLIAEPSAPISLTTSQTEVDCFGNATGEIDLTVSGGSIPYTYDWNNDGVGDNDDSQDILALIGGSYQCIVEDNNGCIDSIVQMVSQPLLPLSGVIEASSVKCFGEETGSISIEMTGGTAPYVYDWNHDGVGDEDDASEIEFLSTGVYNVIVKDSNNCIYNSGGFIAEPALALNADPTIIEPSCFGFTDGSIDLLITGGTSPYVMNWGDEEELLLNNPSELISGLGKGEYLFRITDKNKCKIEQILTVGEPDTIDVEVIVKDVSCYEGSDGEIALVPNGGTTPYTYVWSNASTNQNQANLVTGHYSFLLTDDNGCTFSGNPFVDQEIDINIFHHITGLSCVDQNDAEIEVQTAGGVQPYVWSWSNGESTENITDLFAGTYDLLITDDFGCQKSYEFIVETVDIECVSVVNTFTPNGDGYNDTWVLQNLELYPEAVVKVFNRWGNLLFESSGEYTPWDGSYKGTALPAEVYYYVIVLNNGLDNQYTGSLTIIR